MNADGSGQKRLTRSTGDRAPNRPGRPTDGRSPSSSRRDGNDEVYVMNADGSAQRKLTRNPAGDTLRAWSPDGRKIAFVSKRDGNNEVYVMNADGSGAQRNLTRRRRGRQLSCLVAGRAEDRLRQRPRRQPGGLRHERRRDWAAETDAMVKMKAGPGAVALLGFGPSSP